jgi:hypothetical protein
MGGENRAVDAFDLPPEPDRGDIDRVLARAIKLAIRTHATATVVAYEPTTQKVVVNVGALPVVKVKDATRMPRNMVSLTGVPPNATATLQPITLTAIPVAWPRTNAGYITFPLLPGDTGELHVQDRSLATWLAAGIPCDPVLAFTHAFADSVFHPTLHADTNPMPATDLTATVIEGTLGIKLGRLATSPITKATELVSLMDAAIAAAILAGTGAPGTTGTLAFTAFQTAWDLAKAGIASPKARVE